ncbi:hypothetical protein SAMN04487910_2654 [Aquimarina amphilecti]|uniref:AhpC/TSA family protein n=1 Tax=Aquimarina amphilecti TaxID=1038014 RepID=A0A1H7QRV7_AQUAM|nr:hypothetical protein [Aquimarina amphilecti]SEL50365.1 hypothetical protein SAMN04487910_2654 [Aquimarina amphilecti]
MPKLALHYEKELKGKFNINTLNFLFIFQVNCPGCFLHGIPLVNKLYSKYNQDVSFLGISTAFEDYEFNNLENTKKLIFNEQLVGETKTVFEKQGLSEYTESIDFPIAMDTIADKSFDLEKAAIHICSIHPDYNIWSTFEKNTLKNKVINYLKNLNRISVTFTLNQLRGTPSILIFNDQHEVLYNRFGHIPYDNISSNLNDLIKKFGKDT